MEQSFLPTTMRAMVLDGPGQPLRAASLAVPLPGPQQILLRVAACGVCRTDLHIGDGELSPHKTPLVPGHEVVGYVVLCGPLVKGFSAGARVGVAWLAGSCGHCCYCCEGTENLCEQSSFTGYDIDGGYAQYMVADARYVFHLPAAYSDVDAAPLLCAGLIGYRAYAAAGSARRIGLYGFGAAAHLLAQLARYQRREVYAFTRPGDLRSQEFARSLGAAWAGGSDQEAPTQLDAALLFAPDGRLVPRALAAVRKGGTVVCAGIHMSDVPSFPYVLLWGERKLCSVANLTRADGQSFLRLANECRLSVRARQYPLDDANAAWAALRTGLLDGAAVLVPP